MLFYIKLNFFDLINSFLNFFKAVNDLVFITISLLVSFQRCFILQNFLIINTVYLESIQNICTLRFLFLKS